MIWKPSEKTLLTALACHKIFEKAVKRFKKAGHACPDYLCQVVIGDASVKVFDTKPKYSTGQCNGSTRTGKAVAMSVSERLGKSPLELGGNNAMIVTPSADMDMAVRAILFGAVGTA